MTSRAFFLRMCPAPPCHEGSSGEWDRVPEALEKNHLIIGWAKAEGLLDPGQPEEFQEIIHQAYRDCYDSKPGLAARHAKQAWQFIHGMDEGDLVVVPDGKKFHIGRVASDPWFDASKIDSNSAYRRRAEWLKRSVPRDGAGPVLRAAMRTRLTLWPVRDEAVVEEVCGHLRHQNIEDSPMPIPPVPLNPPIRPTNANLQQYGAPPLAQWLIREAHRGSSLPYGQAAQCLQTEIGFGNIFPLARMGIPAGHLMDQMLAVRPDCPLLNVLLVRQQDRMPGEGAGGYMAIYLNWRELNAPGYRDEHPDEWRAATEAIAADVYAFDEWDQVYLEAFGQPLPAPADPEGQEEDGIVHGRQGEGPNHEQLRLWVLNNPGEIGAAYEGFRTETEVVLASADRVDVVFYGRNETVAIEVKSADSNETDLRRGVFQCIKYRAVMEAMDIRGEPAVTAILVTQEPLPGNLAALAHLNGVQHFLTPRL